VVGQQDLHRALERTPQRVGINLHATGRLI
jgi:hypothetical protein